MKAEKYRAKVRLYHDQLGRIEQGQEFEATPVQMGTIAPYCDKIEPVKSPRKTKAAG